MRERERDRERRIGYYKKGRKSSEIYGGGRSRKPRITNLFMEGKILGRKHGEHDFGTLTKLCSGGH